MKQPGFTYSVHGSLTKTRLRKSKVKETRDSRYIYQNKAFSQHYMTYFKDLLRRTTSDKVLHDNAFEIVSNLKYDGYQTAFSSMVFKIL